MFLFKNYNKLILLLIFLFSLTGCFIHTEDKVVANNSVKDEEVVESCPLRDMNLPSQFLGFFLNGKYYYQGINAFASADSIDTLVLEFQNENRFVLPLKKFCPEIKDGLYQDATLDGLQVFSLKNNVLDYTVCLNGSCQIFVEYKKDSDYLKQLNAKLIIDNAETFQPMDLNDDIFPAFSKILKTEKSEYILPDYISYNDKYILIKPKNSEYWFYYRYFSLEDGYFEIADDANREQWRLYYE